MTQKHIAALIVGLGIFGLLQLILSVRGNMDKAIAAAETARLEEATQLQALEIQRQQFYQLQNGANEPIDFLNAWEDPLEDFTRPEAAEAAFISNIRNANLITLSQRFAKVPIKGGGSAFSEGVAAQVTFEDNYSKLLNWLGRLETSMPALRVTDLKITKGTRPGDVRVEASLVQPIYKP